MATNRSRDKHVLNCAIDESENIYGRLRVIERVPNDKHRRAIWLCRCSCGQICVVAGVALRAGATRSCGCYNKEIAKRRLPLLFAAYDRAFPARRKHRLKTL